MWLPLAPTSRPELSPAAAAASTMRDHRTSKGDHDATAAARLIAQQAMDEARLDPGNINFDGISRLSGKGGNPKAPARGGGHVTGQAGQQQHQQQKQLSSSWCCICSEDATLRCKACEEESGDEPELFCARCFKELHRGEPDMMEHKPQALSSKAGRGRDDT